MISRHSNFDLSSRNTFRMKVNCALFVEISEEADIEKLDWDSLPKPLFVIGGGSNLLFTKDFPGTVLHVGIGAGMPLKGTPFALLTPAPPTGFQPAGPSPYPIAGVQMSLEGYDSTDELLVTLGAGVVFDDFCAWAASEGLWGPENLSLIPGECGASAVQNIGAYGVEAKDIIADIRAWDTHTGTFVHIDPKDCAYGYRTSRFKTEWKGRYIITAVTYRLSRSPQPKLDYGGVRKALEASGKAGGELTPQLIRDTIIGIRNLKLPKVEETGSAGSFFCNPVISREHFEKICETARKDNGPEYQVPHYDTPDGVKVPAAWMIEQCGFKGRRNGGAQVYPGQPLVIVNASGTAAPEEIIGLEQQIISAIREKYGITLHPEVEHL